MIMPSASALASSRATIPRKEDTRIVCTHRTTRPLLPSTTPLSARTLRRTYHDLYTFLRRHIRLPIPFCYSFLIEIHPPLPPLRPTSMAKPRARRNLTLTAYAAQGASEHVNLRVRLTVATDVEDRRRRNAYRASWIGPHPPPQWRGRAPQRARSCTAVEECRETLVVVAA